MNEWTPKEDKLLRKHRPTKTIPQLAKMLRRSENAIIHRSIILGVRGPAKNQKETLCEKCKNIYGGCSWSEIDETTGKEKFVPVEGWEAKKNENGYLVLKCPLFVPDEKREVVKK